MARRRKLGVEVELISPAALAALEPEFPEVAGGAAFFPAAAFLTDPGAMVERLRLSTMQHAGFLSAKVDRLTRQIDGLILEGAGFRLHARQVVLATGAHGRDLAAMAGDVVPLETERGYHVEWDMPEPALNRPCPVVVMSLHDTQRFARYAPSLWDADQSRKIMGLRAHTRAFTGGTRYLRRWIIRNACSANSI